MSATGPRLPPLFKVVVSPLQAFFRLEAASGILLLAAAVAALVLANTGAAPHYERALATPIALQVDAFAVRFTLLELINDGLMAIFFFLVGMEIKRELAHGELRTPARAALPAIAALGGMVVPAGIYLAFNAGGPGAVGWGIPMATDIAFAIGVLTLLKKRVAHGLVVFVTALAIFDDIGGIIVIALFYGTGVQVGWLAAAAGVVALLHALNRFGARGAAGYIILGVVLWYALHHAGIHPTIAGVLTGVTIPARTKRSPREVIADLELHTDELVARKPDEGIDREALLAIEDRLEDLTSPLDRFVHALHGWVAFGIMPLFALANSGVSLRGLSLDDALGPVSLGTAVGLFVGKQLGVFAFALVPTLAKLTPRPANATWVKVYGVSIVAGIGFTVALFIASLAFAREPALLAQAKLGILVGSLASGIVGWAVLRTTRAI